MAERNGQRGSTCFSSQMEDNTSNNGPRPFSATTTTKTAAEYCQHQRRLPRFGLCGLTWNYRVCFREDSCHDKVLGRPIHSYTHTIRGEYPEEHTHLSTAHRERAETLETVWKSNSRKLCFIQREKRLVLWVLFAFHFQSSLLVLHTILAKHQFTDSCP